MFGISEQLKNKEKIREFRISVKVELLRKIGIFDFSLIPSVRDCRGGGAGRGRKGAAGAGAEPRKARPGAACRAGERRQASQNSPSVEFSPQIQYYLLYGKIGNRSAN